MKPLKQSSLTKTLTAAVLTLSLVSQSVAFAGQGAVTGNTNPDPTLAYSAEQLKGIERNLNLDYLKLTPKEVRKRDEKLSVIYDYYREATLGKVAQQIEAAFATNVYHYQVAENGLYTPNLNTKKDVMDSAIRYFTGEGIKQSAFANASPSALQFRESVAISDNRTLSFDRLEGDEKCDYKVRDWNPAFVLSSTRIVSQWHHSGMIFDTVETREALYSSTTRKLFDYPVMDEYLTAMKESQLKALDATVAFVNGNLQKYGTWSKERAPFKVIYPTFSRTAPIPQPVVFISKDATSSDILNMLNQHAPQIYAYNQLFNAQMLPQYAEIERALRDHPEFLAEISKAKLDISSTNTKHALYEAFLRVNYGLLTLGLGTVAFAAMVASPFLAPILITQVTTVIVL